MPRSASVGVDHRAGAMSRAVCDPSFGLSVCESEGDECPAQIVNPNRKALLAPLEELGALHARTLQMPPKGNGSVSLDLVGEQEL